MGFESVMHQDFELFLYQYNFQSTNISKLIISSAFSIYELGLRLCQCYSKLINVETWFLHSVLLIVILCFYVDQGRVSLKRSLCSHPRHYRYCHCNRATMRRKNLIENISDSLHHKLSEMCSMQCLHCTLLPLLWQIPLVTEIVATQSPQWDPAQNDLAICEDVHDMVEAQGVGLQPTCYIIKLTGSFGSEIY